MSSIGSLETVIVALTAIQEDVGTLRDGEVSLSMSGLIELEPREDEQVETPVGSEHKIEDPGGEPTPEPRAADPGLVEKLSQSQEQLTASKHERQKLSRQLDELEQREEEILNELAKERAFAAKLDSEAIAATENFQELSRAKEEQTKEIDELKQSVNDQQAIISRTNAALAAGEESLRQLAEQRDEILNDLSKKQGELQSARTEIESLQRAAQFDQKLNEVIWPRFLAEEKFKEWRAALTNGIFSDPPTPTIVSLITGLFSYSALSRLPEQNSKRMVDVVFDLGTSLYSWFKESSFDREASYANALLWADAINADAAGVLSIMVPEPDTPFDRKTMVSYTGESGISPDVGETKDWCIKDSDGRIQRQAIVTPT